MTVGILMLIGIIALVVIFAIGWAVTGDPRGGMTMLGLSMVAVAIAALLCAAVNVIIQSWNVPL